MYEIEEKDYYEAFGLEAPAQEPDEGEEEQEPAEPAQTDADDGEKDQEVAEPDSQEPEDGPEEATETKKQSVEERRAQAAARRQREIEQAVAAATQKQKAEFEAQMKGFFDQAGLKNPMKDNAPITNMQEFQEFQKAYSDQQIDEALKAGKPTRQTIEQIIKASPEMQQLQQLRQRQEQEALAQQQSEREKLIDEQLEGLKKLNPALGTRQALVDYVASEDGKEFARLVRENNLSFTQAYALTHLDDLRQSAATQEHVRTENNLRGKEHLKATKGQGKGGHTATADEIAAFRVFMPNATVAEIEAYLNK